MAEKINKIAVYGSLRKDLHNHRLIDHCEKLGTFNSSKSYSLFDLGSFPGLKLEGDTSIAMEVYEVDSDTQSNVDMLEGYSEERENNTFYDREVIETPFGKAYTYVYVPNTDNRPKVESGDWLEYLKNRK